MTKDGIEYDLNVSPYLFNKEYENGLYICFTFSSELYKQKFIEKTKHKRQKKIKIFEIDVTLLEDLNDYVKLEKRGFLILINGKEITSINDVKIKTIYSIV